MKVTKIINNNIVTSMDEHGTEMIIMGRGIGFGQKAGCRIPEDRIEKIFRLSSQAESQKLIDIIEDIPLEHIQAADQVITYARTMLGDKLKDTIYLSLIDHIHCAIDRQKDHLLFSNPLLPHHQRSRRQSQHQRCGLLYHKTSLYRQGCFSRLRSCFKADWFKGCDPEGNRCTDRIWSESNRDQIRSGAFSFHKEIG